MRTDDRSSIVVCVQVRPAAGGRHTALPIFTIGPGADKESSRLKYPVMAGARCIGPEQVMTTLFTESLILAQDERWRRA
jgi:hypothetical protein